MVLTSKRFDDTYRWRGAQVSRCEETVPPNFTSKDVARLAGVSQSTVSYVLSGKRPISEATRRKVLEAIEDLTYEPNAGARALASQRTSVIGLVVPFHPGSDAAGMLPFIETIASSARARDHEVLLVTADEGSAGLRRLAGRSLCDAIVMMDIEAHDERIPVAASLRVPVVLVGVPEQPAGLRCVDLDFREAGRLAVDELAETGHDRVICLGYPAEVTARDLNYVRRFMNSVQERADHHRLPYEVIAPVEPGRAGASVAVDQVLGSRGRGRLGLIIPAAQVVQPVLHALDARGVVPGRDISVIGVCTDASAQETEPPITNVSLEPRDVSRRAVEALFWLLAPTFAGPPPMVDLVAPRLSRRDTVMPAALPAGR
jgi:DNA-binding LacI/PurR family transcriptional regulator